MEPGKPGANKVLGKRKKLRTKITAKVQKIKPRGNKLQQRQEENAAGKKEDCYWHLSSNSSSNSNIVLRLPLSFTHLSHTAVGIMH